MHYRVETLTPLKLRASSDPGSDFIVSGEQRGSYVLERYLDVNAPMFQGSSPKVDATTVSLAPYYQFRILRHSIFGP